MVSDPQSDCAWAGKKCICSDGIFFTASRCVDHTCFGNNCHPSHIRTDFFVAYSHHNYLSAHHCSLSFPLYTTVLSQYSWLLCNRRSTPLIHYFSFHHFGLSSWRNHMEGYRVPNKKTLKGSTRQVLNLFFHESRYNNGQEENKRIS